MMKQTTTAEENGHHVTTSPGLTEPEIPVNPAGADQLVVHIQRAIRRETSGRVHNLSVVVTGTHVVLDGFCSTFHCYQLAQHAAMLMAEDLSVDNQIEVL